MTQYRTERKLTWIYSGIAVLNMMGVVCFTIVFNHWKNTLDLCPGNRLQNLSCGCILYGINGFEFFTGGRNATCHYVLFGTLPLIVYAMIMASFHIYRVCINTIGKYEEERGTTVEQREGEVIVMTSRSAVVNENDNDGVVFCWRPNACVAAFVALYSLVHAAILTDGYFKTCTQYRHKLIKTLRSTGNQVSVIHSRLACQSIYDFMDYLEPDVNNQRRGDFINTGAALQLAIISFWASVLLWIAVVVYTSIRAHKERDVLTCCGK